MLLRKSLLAASILAALIAPNFHSEPVGLARVDDTNGLRTVTFDTIYGTVKTNLPDDLSAGDTISGTVILEPKGQDESTIATNLEQLKKFSIKPETGKPFLMPIEDVFRIEGRGTVASGRVFRWNAPEGTSTENLLLIDAGDREAGREQLQILPRAPTGLSTSPTARDYQLPAVTQAGRPAQAHGIFDGDFSSTHIRLGGHNALLLAESPRKIVFESPATVIGPSDLRLKERDVVATGRCNNLRLSLTSPKTTLRSGEQTNINVEVRGLEGLQQDAPLRMEKISGGVTVQGGDTQVVTIKPTDVQSGGIYRTSRTVTANSPGDFAIRAIIVLPPLPPSPPGPTVSASPNYPAPSTTQPTQPTQPAEPERHFTVAPKCPCIPPEDKIAIDMKRPVILTVGWLYGPSYQNADDARKGCEAKLPEAVTKCRGEIIAEIAKKVRSACVTSQKIDESCAPGVKCKPTDTAGLPNPDGITTDAKCIAELVNAPGPPGRKVHIGKARGTCSFKGIIYVLCDP